jgi:REP element-mobilizing transposase RayT
MPNHVHAIIIITTDNVGAGPCACPITTQPQDTGQPQGVAPTGMVKSLSLPDAVHRYKTMTTKRYVDGVKTFGWTQFHNRLWQRNYYEHIIRNDNEYQRIAKYIENNPTTWKDDKLWIG